MGGEPHRVDRAVTAEHRQRDDVGTSRHGVPAPGAAVDEPAHELVPEDDLLVGAHRALVADVDGDVSELVAVVTGVKVGAADPAPQHLDQQLAPSATGSGRSSTVRAASLQTTALMPG